MFDRRSFCFLLACLLPAAPHLFAQSQKLRIGAAADLQPVLPALVADFQKKTGDVATVSYASSATLTTQILNGAPYDVFLAANTAFPQKIVDAKLSVENRPVVYARGSLVLWARKGITLHGTLSMPSLTDAAVHRVAVANPAHAPYGAAAIAAIRSLGLMKDVQPKLVYAENIAQAAQFGQSGNADVALISLTLAITPTMRQAGQFVPVPMTAYPAIEQGAVIMKNAASKQAGLDFLQYLNSAAAGKVLSDGGLQPAKK